ncbi:glycosyltransferase family 4 protein [Alkalihalobacillus sp. AL-G]|uniref:glycosyltransferase family 4 protein n=1 Tax=Alkalihalobacillus sp. AL-G TaxID=2926399 RepID=UPI00272D284A|nr:glycosyltransferase family 4 protein [Alkalihalobacillus sp. AL-G]WLD94950.1 glycosyltransferase family 4 protein [Alkalihalobacillus sp. AL-G]
MRVLFVFYISSGGVETLNRHRIKALSKCGITCHLLYQDTGSGHQNIVNIQSYILKQPADIISLIKKQNYDLIVVCSNHLLLRTIKASGYKGILVYENQGLGNINQARRYLTKAAPMILHYADGLLYPKTQHLANLTTKYLPGLPQFSFHNCFDLETFHYRSGSPVNLPIVGWVGRIEKNKNWKAFLKIGERLCQAHPDLKLWMFIDHTLTKQTQQMQFERMIDRLNLKSRLSVFNSVTNDSMAVRLSEIADSGGFLCSTSHVEGFGYSLVEAMSCRCPVLSTDSDGIKSIIIDDVTGLYYDHDKIAEAFEKGDRLLRDKGLRNQLTKNALAHITKMFSPHRYTKEFLNMYQTLLNITQ